MFRLLGIAYITIPSDHCSFVTDAILFLFNLTTFACLFAHTRYERCFIEPTIMTIGGKWLFRYGFTAVCATYVGSFVWYRRRVIEIVLALSRTDDELSSCGVQISHRQHRRVAWKFVIFMCLNSCAIPTVLLVIRRYLCVFDWRYDLSNWYQVFINIMNKNAIIAVYGFAVLSIQQRIHLLNSALRDVIHLGKNHCKETICKLRIVQAQLVDICDECNLCLAGPAMALTAFVLGMMLLQFYLIYDMLARGGNMRKYYLGVVACINVDYVLMLLFVVAVGSRLAHDGQETGCLVHEVVQKLNRRTAVEERRELEIFEHQVLHRRPVANCALFTFDWTLVFSVRRGDGLEKGESYIIPEYLSVSRCLRRLLRTWSLLYNSTNKWNHLPMIPISTIIFAMCVLRNKPTATS